MGEEFEDRDLSDSVFWGVNLERTTFRDAVFNGSTFFHTEWRDAAIDGIVERLVVNGVDVTDFVNRHDRWYPLRERLSPASVVEMRATWSAICAEWDKVEAALDGQPHERRLASVNGEWSLCDTYRHLLFAMDKWFSWPILGERTFNSMGLPNTGSQGLDWPGIDRSAYPEFDAVFAARQAHTARFTQYLGGLRLEDLPESVEIIENGDVPSVMCFHVVFEEEFEHLRYMVRDLGLG